MTIAATDVPQGIDEKLRGVLRSVVETCRRALEADYFQQAEATFGVHRNGSIEPLERLSHLDSAGRRARAAIEEAIAHERAGGAGAAEAVQRYIRESAFTMLNRFAAL